MDAAQLLLGHANPDMTAHYAKVDLETLIAVAREIG